METLSRYNGVPSVSLSIQKRAGENIVRICDEVRRLLAEERGRLPAGVELPLAFDESRNIRRMVADLENSMANGFVLVVGVILFFMGLMNSLFVGLAIPFSMLISFAVLHAMGYTLNIIVLFSLILSLGMLVDNAIVIVDNIYRHMQMGKARVAAAIDGTAEVAWPVTTSTLTTVAAFFPMLFWPGIMGEFMSYLPATLIVTLSASLFVALVDQPGALRLVHAGAPEAAARAPAGASTRFMRGYERVLAFSIDRHKTSIAVGFASLVAIIAIYGKFGKGVEFFPAIESTRAQITVKTPRGTSLATTDRSRAAPRRPRSAARTWTTSSRTSARAAAASSSARARRARTPRGSRSTSASGRSSWSRPRARWSASAPAVDREIVGAEVIVDEEQHGPPTGAAGEPGDHAARTSSRSRGSPTACSAAIKDIPGVVDLEDDYDQGRPEIRVRVDKERAELLGLSTVEVALAVRAAVNGVEAGVFREGDEEYDITVRLPKAERSSLDAREPHDARRPHRAGAAERRGAARDGERLRLDPPHRPEAGGHRLRRRAGAPRRGGPRRRGRGGREAPAAAEDGHRLHRRAGGAGEEPALPRAGLRGRAAADLADPGRAVRLAQVRADHHAHRAALAARGLPRAADDRHHVHRHHDRHRRDQPRGRRREQRDRAAGLRAQRARDGDAGARGADRRPARCACGRSS